MIFPICNGLVFSWNINNYNTEFQRIIFLELVILPKKVGV